MAPEAAVADPVADPVTPEAPIAPVVTPPVPVAPVVTPPTPAVADPPAAPPPPVRYALTVPAGAEQWFDPLDLETLARRTFDKGLTHDQAQALLADQAAELAQMSAAFRTATETDPTYGGEHLADTQRLGNLALDKVRPKGTARGDALRRVLAKTGMDNHVEVVGFLADLGALMAEDRPGGAGAQDGSTPDLAHRLYPNAKS